MHSRLSTRNAKRYRRARRRGRMVPAEALPRFRGWTITKSITRWHRRDLAWSDED